MKHYNKIAGLSLVCFDDEDNGLQVAATATKRSSCSTQRTSSRGSRSIDSDLNISSLFDSEHLSFGEKPFFGIDAQESLGIRTVSTELYTPLAVHTDSPWQGKDHCRSKEIQYKAKTSCVVFSPDSPVQENTRHHRSKNSMNRKGNPKSNTFYSVHTLTGAIPLFECESKTEKNVSSIERICKRSTPFRYFSRKHAAIHDESTDDKKCKVTPNLIKEHRIEKGYDFYAREALRCWSSSRKNTPKATTRRSDCSHRRQHDRSNVHQQVKVFMENCTIHDQP